MAGVHPSGRRVSAPAARPIPQDLERGGVGCPVLVGRGGEGEQREVGNRKRVGLGRIDGRGKVGTQARHASPTPPVSRAQPGRPVLDSLPLFSPFG